MGEIRIDRDAPEHGGNGGSAEPEFSIGRSNALLPLLVLFALTVLTILVVIVRAKPFVPPVGAAADRSFAPADFPALFAKDEALTGLDGGAGSGGASVLFPVPAAPALLFSIIDILNPCL